MEGLPLFRYGTLKSEARDWGAGRIGRLSVLTEYFPREYFHQFRVRPTASKVPLASPATGAISFPARIGIDGEIPWSLPATTRHQSCLDCLSALSAFQSLHLLPMLGRRTGNNA